MSQLTFATGPSNQGQAGTGLYPETRIVAAIDFGTTHSGFAMAHVDDRRVTDYRDWPSQIVQYPKNLTCIRYDSNDEVSSWGYNARYAENGFCLERFKLYLDPNISNMPPLPPRGVVCVISDYLRVLHQFFLEYMERRYGRMYNNTNVMWILTVPAMWNERAKQLMSDSAVQAGIISAQDANDRLRFRIVLEPEAAAMTCCEYSNLNALRVNDTFIVVDAGGGTVDLAAYCIAKNPSTGLESLRELCNGNGASCGSTFVDESFLAFLERKCGSTAVQRFRETLPRIWHSNILRPWEQIKREFRGSVSFSAGHLVESIAVPPGLKRLMTATDVQRLESESDGEIQMTLNDLKAMFDPVIQQVIQLINTQIIQCNNNIPGINIDKIFLIGGFGQSSYLYEAIKNSFQNIALLRPADCGGAIMAGAVLLGLNHRYITARCARFTYGLRISGPLTPDNPAGEEEKFWNHRVGSRYANNLFHPMVIRGMQIEIDNPGVSQEFMPTERNQTYAKCEIYQTDSTSVTYFDTQIMKYVGTLLVPISGRNNIGTKQALHTRINIVQDVSGSMAGTRINACKAGIKSLCDVLGPQDEVGVIEFGDMVTVCSNISSNPISRSELPDYVDAMQIRGNTALYDAIYKGLRTLKAATEHRNNDYIKNHLIVYTDGEENSSRISFSTLSSVLQNHGIPNFRFTFGGMGNQQLLNLSRTSPCNEYCKIIQVEDSKEGITAAFDRIRQDIQLSGSRNSGPSVKFKMHFGESKITAEAICDSTGMTRLCHFDYQTARA